MNNDDLGGWISEQLPDFDRVAMKRIKSGDRVWELTRSADGATARIEVTDHVIVLGPLEQRLKEACAFMPRIQSGEIRGIRITREQGVVEWPES